MSRPRCATLDSRVYSLVQWGMAAIKVVQAFTKEEEEHRRFMGASRDSLRATLRLYNWQTLYSGGVNAVIALGTAIVVYAGARSVMTGTLSIGQLIVFIAYLAQLYDPINKITQSWGLIAGARVGAARVFEVLDTEADLQSGSREFAPEGAKGAIALARRQLPLPARDAAVDRQSISPSPPARRSPSSGRPAPENRRCSACWRGFFRPGPRHRHDRRLGYSRLHPPLAAPPDRDGVCSRR